MRGRNEKQMNRAFRDDALGDVHVRAVFEKRGIQRGEGIALRVEIPAQVLFDRSGIARDLRCEIVHASLRPADCRSRKALRAKRPSTKTSWQPRRGFETDSRSLLRGQGMAVADKAERSLRDRGADS